MPSVSASARPAAMRSRARAASPRGVAVEEHRRPGAAGADDVGARAEALVHREGVGEVALGVVPAMEAGGEHAGIQPV